MERRVSTPDDALRAALAAEPGRPLITQYDDSTGERVELSVATVENWVAKTANLVQEAGVEPGSTAAVLLPAHWQTAVILLGCWRAGVGVALFDDYAGPVAAGTTAPTVAFAAANRVEEALALDPDELWALSLAPMAIPLKEVPKGADDYAVEVRGQGDRFSPYAPIDPTGPGLTTPPLTDLSQAEPPPAELSLAELIGAGEQRASALGLGSGGRLLVAGPASPLDWLLAPLAADAALVLLRHPDPARIDHLAATERTTARLP